MARAESRSDFYARVYDLVRQVPPGKVTTYGTLALALGRPHWARQVGWALAALPTVHPGEPVPAHRVVNAVGALSGGWAFGTPEVQRGLLEEEGVEFDAQQRVPLERFLWAPPVGRDA
jgi:methylated-DNA-protein-cysteine methyltransferase-like protein